MLICDPCLFALTPNAAFMAAGAKVQRGACDHCSKTLPVYDIPQESLLGLPIPQDATPDLPPVVQSAPDIHPAVLLAVKLYQDVVNAVEEAKLVDPKGEILMTLGDPAQILLRNIELVVGQATLPSLLRK